MNQPQDINSNNIVTSNRTNNTDHNTESEQQNFINNHLEGNNEIILNLKPHNQQSMTDNLSDNALIDNNLVIKSNPASIYPQETLGSYKTKNIQTCMKNLLSDHKILQFKYISVYLSHIVLIILNTLLLIFIYNNPTTNLDSSLYALNTIAYSLSSDPILDIQVASSCPNGYSKAIIGNWPGTRYGCRCSTYIIPDSCTKKNTNCRTVSRTSTFNLELFNSTNEYICIKRAQINIDYKKSEVCESTFGNECYPGFCFSGISCPVTNVSLTSTPESSEFYSYQGKNLNIYKRSGVMPLAGINTSYYGMPCFQEGRYDYFDEKYVLHYGTTTGCGTVGLDKNSFYLANSVDELVLVNNNVSGLRPEILNLPLYEDFSSKIPVFLVGRSRIETKKSEDCLNINVDSFFQKINKVDNTDSIILISIIFDYIFMGIAFISSNLLFLITLCDKKLKEGLNETIIMMSSVFRGLTTIVYLTCIPFIIISIQHYKDLDNTLKEIVDCFVTEQPVQAIDSYSKMVAYIGNHIYGYMLTILSLKLICNITCCPFCDCKRKKK